MRSEIHQEALSCANEYRSSEQNLFTILIEVDRHRIFEDFEYTHLTPYCVKKLKLSEDITKCLVRIVRKSLHVPELAEAVMHGLSIHKARVITAAITPENAPEWIEKAQTLPKAQLEKEVAESRGIKTKNVKLELTHETEEKLNRVRDLVSTKQGEFSSLEHALEKALDEYLYRHDPVEKAKRSRDPSAKQQVTIRDDDRCQFIYQNGSQCDEAKWVHQHHMIHRQDGGPDTSENLITLCAGHHRLVHRNANH